MCYTDISDKLFCYPVSFTGISSTGQSSFTKEGLSFAGHYAGYTGIRGNIRETLPYGRVCRGTAFVTKKDLWRCKMDYSIFNEKLAGVSDGTFSVVAELVASSSETIPYYDTVEGRILAPGSVAIVPSETAIYILDTDLFAVADTTCSSVQ